MRWAVVLFAVAGCDQLFGIRSVQPASDGATPDDGTGIGEIRFVQNNYSVCAGVLTCATKLPTRSPSSDALLVTVTYDNATSQVSELTDDAGNTYTNLIPPTTWASTPYRTESWYGVSNGGGNPITLTATFSVATNSLASVYLDEYSGASASAPIDQSAVMTGFGPVTDTSSGFKTTATPRELIFGHGEGDGGSVGPGSGFITRLAQFGNIEEDRFVTSIDSYDASFTAPGASAWLALMITLR